MNKEYIQKMFADTLTEEEQGLMRLFSVICAEGLSRKVAYDLLNPENPRIFDSLVDGLHHRNWIFCDHQTIFCEQIVAEAVLETSPIDEEISIGVLSSLQKSIVVQPLDDLLSKQQHFVAARLLLTYLLDQWNKRPPHGSEFLNLFCDVVIAFAQNIELSYYTNNRKRISALEDRIDFKLLNLIKYQPISHYYKGVAKSLLGQLYTSIFRYDAAKASFALAERYLCEDADLLLSQAIMYENLGMFGKAFQMALRSHILSKKRKEHDANIKVCLYIAYLCALCKSYDSCKNWRRKARSIIGGRTIPTGHPINITFKEIEALLHIEDHALAVQILDAAELAIIKLFGAEAPEMGRIAYIRSLVDGEAGLSRSSNEHYRRYVENNHYNFGYSKGDTAMLYASIINDNVMIGNTETANHFTAKMHNLHAEEPSFAPGVRLSQAFTNCLLHLSDENPDLSKAYLEAAKRIYDEELRLDNETVEEIKGVFRNDIIPEMVLSTDGLKNINIATINFYLREGRIDEAKQRIEELAVKENDPMERLKWNFHYGRCLFEDGNRNEAMQMWDATIQQAPNARKFEIAKDIAEWARGHDYSYDAVKLYEKALEPEIMVYGRTCDIAAVLQGYAGVLEYCRFKEKSDEPWEQALLLMQSIGDRDGMALLYFSWSLAKQDEEAENLLKKAIELWKPEPYLFDEMLSRMYYFLSQAQAMQGKSEEAKDSARKSVMLYPTEYPEHLLEDIEENL